MILRDAGMDDREARIFVRTTADLAHGRFQAAMGRYASTT